MTTGIRSFAVFALSLALSACGGGSGDPATDKCAGVVCAKLDDCHPGVCDPASGSCSTPAAADGTACGDAADKCLTGTTCSAGVCGGGAPKSCAAIDDCHAAGTCNPSTGTCSTPAAADGTACATGDSCLVSETCTAGVCGGGSPRVCPGADACHTVAACDPTPITGGCPVPLQRVIGADCSGGNLCTLDTCNAAGVCTPNPVSCTASDACHVAGACNPGTGLCSNPAGNEGAVCNFATDKCLVGTTCASGVCGGGAAKTCTALDQCHDAGTCDSATGACSDPAKADNTACDDGNLCTQADWCVSGACTGNSPVACADGYSCKPVDGVCHVDSLGLGVPAPQVAKAIPFGKVSGLALDLAGAAFVASDFAPPSRTVDGIDIPSLGLNDVFLARFDPASPHAATWARSYGDGNDQLSAGVAVTQDGTVAAIGTFLGAIIPGVTNTNALPIDFLLTVDAATGNAIQARAFNENSATVAGKLLSVAANPARNEIAVCGYAAAAATDLVPGATFGGGTRDAVLAVFDSDLTLRWAKQLPGAADEECDAIAIADDGSVFAAGQYNGATTAITALDPGGGAFENPGNAFRKYVWVAKYDVNGTFVAQASFGRGTGATPANGNHKPLSLAVDAAGKLVVGGYHNLTLALGGTSLVSAGGNDGFVARLDPAAGFAPVWAKRIGSTGADELRGVAVDSMGDVTAVGIFSGSTTGAAAFSVAGGTDAFALKLDQATGATQYAASFGDSANQQADRVAIARGASGPAANALVYGGSFAGALTFPAPAGTLSTTGPGDTQAFLVFATFAP